MEEGAASFIYGKISIRFNAVPYFQLKKTCFLFYLIIRRITFAINKIAVQSLQNFLIPRESENDKYMPKFKGCF